MMSTIGAAVIATVASLSLTANKYIFVNSLLVTQYLILAAVTGEKWTRTHVSTEQTKKIVYNHGLSEHVT